VKLLRTCPILLTLLLFAAPVLAGGRPNHFPPGLTPAGGPLIPVTFQGIWNYTEVVKDCTTMQVLGTFTGTDTVCADDDLAPSDTVGLAGFSCDGTTSDTQYNVTCSGGQEVTPGCTQSFNFTIVSTLNGNTVTSVTTITVSYTGCGPIPSSCVRYEYTGTRVGPATAQCATPVQATTWSGIKAQYR